MVKFYQALRDGWGRQPVISRFMSHGIWAFGAPFGKWPYLLALSFRFLALLARRCTNGTQFIVILTVNTLCMALLKGAIASVAYS